MPSYIITYDLRKAANYESLITALRDAHFVSPLKSVWLGNSASTAAQLRDALRSYMDSDDGILVIELKPGSEWAFQNLNSEEASRQWLKRNIRQ